MVSVNGLLRCVVYKVITTGINEVFCGNPARALRARRKKKGLTQQVKLFTL